MKVILVHGIHAREGDSNMAALLPHLSACLPGRRVMLFGYGFMGFWQARFDNARHARALAALIEPGDVVITHSNGAAIAYLACRRHGAAPAGIVNINPALDRWRTAPVEWVETIHSDGDRWVWLSQWLPFHLWGDQGKVGYRGGEDNTINHHATAFSGHMGYRGHCDLFAEVRIGLWARFIGDRIGERLDDAEWMRSQVASLSVAPGPESEAA